jgi:hypothetical protein
MCIKFVIKTNLSYTYILEILFLYISAYHFRKSVKTFIRNNNDNVIKLKITRQIISYHRRINLFSTTMVQ